MKIFKFGGASVKNAAGVKNILNVLHYTGYEKTLIVVSAMGKTTNALEQVVQSFFDNKEMYLQDLEKVKENHYCIIEDLFDGEKVEVNQKVTALFDGVLSFLRNTDIKEYSMIYDQVVSVGELVSSTIISKYMNREGMENCWLDALQCIKTDT